MTSCSEQGGSKVKLRYLVGAFLALYVTAMVVSLRGQAVAGNGIAAATAILGIGLTWWANKHLSERFPEDRQRSQHMSMWLYAILGATAVYHLTEAVGGHVTVATVFVPSAVLLGAVMIYASYGAHDH